jgi:hypothetical protein
VYWQRAGGLVFIAYRSNEAVYEAVLDEAVFGSKPQGQQE